tara:strand:- start:26153 stop:26659 length:507 start_codon:yes stop_codon:yes gene_type:complete
MAYNDTIAKNIRKQVALNAGPINIASNNITSAAPIGGSYAWVDSNTRQLVKNAGNAGNWLTTNVPYVQTAQITANIYNRVRGIFQKLGVPNQVSDPLIASASYYIAQNKSVDPNKLYNEDTGQLDPSFIAVYNSLRDTSSQIGVVKSNTAPNWQNNVLLRGNLQGYGP